MKISEGMIRDKMKSENSYAYAEPLGKPLYFMEEILTLGGGQ
jgi:hypothetical protein